MTFKIALVARTRYSFRYREVQITRHEPGCTPTVILIPWIHLDRTSHYFNMMVRNLKEAHRDFIASTVRAGDIGSPTPN